MKSKIKATIFNLYEKELESELRKLIDRGIKNIIEKINEKI